MKDIKTMLLTTHDIKEIRGYFDYKGEEITHYSVTATSQNIRESVSKENMEYNKEQGRSLLDVILLKVFQLGYSQANIIRENDPTNQFIEKLMEKQIQEFEEKRKNTDQSTL
jgi:ABC-type multidrug transport system ATPase subunit